MHNEPQSLPWDEVPRPLHINKQPAGSDKREYRSTTAPRSRCSSSESNITDASLNSIPESPGGENPLKVPKRRGDRSIQMKNGDGAHNSSQEQLTDANGEMALPDAFFFFFFFFHLQDRPPIPPAIPPKSNHRPRRSNSCNNPYGPFSRGLAARRPVLDGSADHPDTRKGTNSPDASRLRTAKSMFHMARRANDMEIDTDDIVTPPRSPLPPDPDPGSPSGELDDAAPLEPSVLVPHIVVTPENKALDEGAVTLWATIQISTQISRASAPDQVRHEDACGWPPGHSRELSPPDVFGYGCLYDVSVEILPTSKSAIIELVDDKACAKITLYPGSRLLLVAHVRLLPTAVPRSRNHLFRQSSDDLMEDLEYHLGSTMTEYLQVRMTYRHSGFPQQGIRTATTPTQTAAHDGVASTQTTIQTTAVAIIKRHNSSSPWSPRPRVHPQPNPLFEIIASHWGVQTASKVMQRILHSRMKAPRRPGTMSPPPHLSMPSALGGYRTISGLVGPEETEEDIFGGDDDRFGNQQESKSDETVRAPAQHAATTRVAPPIPKRQASLRQVTSPFLEPESDEDGEEAEEAEMGKESRPSGMVSTTTNTTTPRTSYRLSKVKRMPSLIKAGAVNNSHDTTPTARTNKGSGRGSSVGNTASRGEQQQQQQRQQRASPMLSGRRSLGGTGDGPRLSIVGEGESGAGEQQRGRQRERESGSGNSQITTNTKSSGYGRSFNSKPYSSAMANLAATHCPVNNTPTTTSRKGGSGKKDKEGNKEQKEKGWTAGWSAWW
ncbi:hypothetical protein QBC42DRAFT_222120 [Cladorrhinum samala]|uniref:Uncharacterized protein n=1 Tax=Cladorrhinum samala TaxID=585594 RepID=A0AAV9HSE7_9PEZI|nr:hypothetical protein QBC42DRAFT_222120 [Cladorrhinum samala]